VTTAGAIVAAAGLFPLLAGGSLVWRRMGFVAWVAGSLWVAGWLLSGVLSRAHHDASRHLALAAAVVVLGAIGLAVASVLAHRHPWLFLGAVVAAAPARIPITLGGTSANLLVPLYAVIAAGVLAGAWELARREDRPSRLGRVGAAVGALVAWSAVSMLWSQNRHQGAVELLFFYLPFGFLIARLGELPNRRGGLRRLFGVQLALAAAFGVVALWQEATRHLFWNPTIQVSNDYTSFFRVNSLFWDSSIYARFMAVTIVLLAGLAIHRRFTPALGAGIAGLFVAMYFAYSQSALLALAVGVVALGSALWPRRVTIGLAAVAAAGGLLALVIALHGHSANRVTSDRLHLIRLGERVVEHHPLLGAGIGGFARAALAGTAHPYRLTGAASHTTPVTMIAEQGPLGLVLYLLVLAAVASAALRQAGDRGLRLTLAAAFAALVTSSLFYNAFFEDPTTWICMALIALATSTSRPLTATERPA
jgi:hypothetical protein